MSAFSHQEPSSLSTHDENTLDTPKEHPLTEIVRFSIIAILIVIPIRMFIAQPFIVSGASMENTFHNGQYLIVDQVSYYFNSPDRGDVVIFRYPKDPSKFFIKRVIGVPGDTVTIENSIVTVTNAEHPDGFVLDEPYIRSMAPEPKLTETLGEREYFVMGDNRDQSSDSRSWGVLQEERIVGRALIRLFPPGELDYLPGAVTITEELLTPKTYLQ
ncbi:signal peptidase I [Candidatus Kaiserbacteria bacterium]|nr:signal peptidase I [Candidatus Kaiserbacteria bacterium]MCB9812059.1 signal peptidase I [Candidatus Nomurabacteria bacterium]